MKVNLGCGAHVTDGWLNVDYAIGAKLAKLPLFRTINKKIGLFGLDWDDRILVHDLRTRFPWGNETVDAIYSSHTLEHFTREEGRHFLEECHRVLKSTGLIRLVVPDLAPIVHDYINGKLRSDYFLEKLGVLYGGGKSGLKAKLATLIEFPHKCMYDAPTLVSILGEIGIISESRPVYASEIADIKIIEREHRTVNAVVVEGRKRS